MTQFEQDIKYMRAALDEAKQAFDADEIPIGAVVVNQNRIIGRGHNLTEMLNDVTAHAEMQAITAAANTLGGKYLQDCTLYVTVEPCMMCAGAIGGAKFHASFMAQEMKNVVTRHSPIDILFIPKPQSLPEYLPMNAKN